jgi:hypothetical protein
MLDPSDFLIRRSISEGLAAVTDSFACLPRQIATRDRIFIGWCRSIFEQFLIVLAPVLKKLMFADVRKFEGHHVAPAARAIRK